MASALLRADAAWRLGPRAVGLGLWGKGPGRWLAGRRLGTCQSDALAGHDLRPAWEANRWTSLGDDPELRLKVLAVCVAVIEADGHVFDREATVFRAVVEQWGLQRRTMPPELVERSVRHV